MRADVGSIVNSSLIFYLLSPVPMATVGECRTRLRSTGGNAPSFTLRCRVNNVVGNIQRVSPRPRSANRSRLAQMGDLSRKNRRLLDKAAGRITDVTALKISTCRIRTLGLWTTIINHVHSHTIHSWHDRSEQLHSIHTKWDYFYHTTVNCIL